MFQSIMMVVMYQATPKQHLKLNSKVKQRWGWAEKSVAYKKAWNFKKCWPFDKLVSVYQVSEISLALA